MGGSPKPGVTGLLGESQEVLDLLTLKRKTDSSQDDKQVYEDQVCPPVPLHTLNKELRDRNPLFEAKIPSN
jgi:hypothetical protein